MNYPLPVAPELSLRRANIRSISSRLFDLVSGRRNTAMSRYPTVQVVHRMSIAEFP
jgi:hypothetical protein